MHYLFWLIELFSMLMTAFIGTCCYIGGFVIAVIYVCIRWIYRNMKGGART